MNHKKVTVIVLLTLVLATTTITIFNHALAQTTEDPQKQTVQTLLEILDKNNKTVVASFNRFDTQNIQIPQTAKTAYNLAVENLNNAVVQFNQENYRQASTDAVEAMQNFEEALTILETASPTEPTQTELDAQTSINLRNDITRTYDYVSRLENLTLRAKAAGYDTTTATKKLVEIKRHLANATSELENQNLDGASESLLTAKTLINELDGALERLTTQIKAANTERYLEAAETRVSAIRADVNSSPTLSAEAKQDALAALNNSELSLSNARDAIENNNVDDAVTELEEAKKWEEESARAISAVTDAANSSTSIT